MNLTFYVQWYYRWASISLLLTFVLAGCNRFDVVELYMRPNKREVQAGGTLEIGVRVKNPPSGIRYRWRATRGKCEPQDSPNLSTTYTAPKESGEVRITLEAVHREKTLFADEVVIQVIGAATPESAVAHIPPLDMGTQATPPPIPHVQPQIRITQIPRYDSLGGSTSAADIEGEVSALDPTNFRVVIYALTDRWYVQPLAAAPFTDIGQDGRWSTWTHTGTKYAALLVRPTFQPQSIIPALPGVGRDVVAITTVTGNR